MGGCATKPRELKEEAAAPRPIEEKPKVVDVAVEEKEKAVAVTETQVTNDVVVVVVDERKSLGHLFKESEETKVEAPETEEVTVKEAVVEPAVEPKEEEEHPKTQEHPADEKFKNTPVPEKTLVPSEAIATVEKHVDSSSNVVVAQTAEVEAVVAGSPKVEAKEYEQPKPPVEEKFITPPVPEKTPAPSEAIATGEKHVDSSSNVVDALTAEVEAVVAESPKVEQKEAVVPVTTSSTEKVGVEESPKVA